MKIPFDIKYRPQIESGEYKVETRSGQTARIVCWDRVGPQLVVLVGKDEDVLTYNLDGTTGQQMALPSDLFIVTPDPELSEFEERIFKLLRQYKECDIPLTPENIKAEASMLWSDFEKYFFDLYGKDGESDSALRRFYYSGLADGKEEALKDLPRWEKMIRPTEGPVSLIKTWHGAYRIDNHIEPGDSFIHLSMLEKLPGFKED